MEDVARGIADKLISRHPYVFATAEVPVDLHYTWEQRKAAEKGRTSALQGIPEQLSALARANKIIGKARSRRVELAAARRADDGGGGGCARSWRWRPALRRPESTRSRRFVTPYAVLEAQVRHAESARQRRDSGLAAVAYPVRHVRAPAAKAGPSGDRRIRRPELPTPELSASDTHHRLPATELSPSRTPAAAQPYPLNPAAPYPVQPHYRPRAAQPSEELRRDTEAALAARMELGLNTPNTSPRALRNG